MSAALVHATFYHVIGTAEYREDAIVRDVRPTGKANKNEQPSQEICNKLLARSLLFQLPLASEVRHVLK